MAPFVMNYKSKTVISQSNSFEGDNNARFVNVEYMIKHHNHLIRMSAIQKKGTFVLTDGFKM